MMNSFRLVTAILWAVIIFVSIRAIQQLGVDGANIFFDDFAHPWRAQFNTDFFAHLLLLAGWIVYRESKWWIGIVCALLCLVGGGAFSLAYILVATVRCRGDVRWLLLGKHVADGKPVS